MHFNLNCHSLRNPLNIRDVKHQKELLYFTVGILVEVERNLKWHFNFLVKLEWGRGGGGENEEQHEQTWATGRLETEGSKSKAN